MAEDYVRPPLVGAERRLHRPSRLRPWLWVALAVVVCAVAVVLALHALSPGGENNPGFTNG